MVARVWPVDAVAGSPSYIGRALRQIDSALIAPGASGRPVGGRTGLSAGTPTGTVTATSTTWTVRPHSGVLDAQTAAAAGPYRYAFDASVTGSVNAADSNNPRIDLLYVQLSDPAESDGTSTPGVAIGYLAGTAAASPAAPATPARSMPLAQINVPAAGGGSPTITNVAPYTTASGGIIPIGGSGQLPPAPYVGQYVDDPTLGLQRWDGTAWSGPVPAAIPSGWSDLPTVSAASGLCRIARDGQLVTVEFNLTVSVAAGVAPILVLAGGIPANLRPTNSAWVTCGYWTGPGSNVQPAAQVLITNAGALQVNNRTGVACTAVSGRLTWRLG